MLGNDYCYSLEMEVRDYELDSEGIVNNANYLHYLEHTRHKFCEEAGYSFKDLLNRGIITVVRKIEIKYINPLHSGDRFKSYLSIKREGACFIFRQDIYKQSGEKVLEAKVSIASVFNGKISRGDELADLFSKYLS